MKELEIFGETLGSGTYLFNVLCLEVMKVIYHLHTDMNITCKLPGLQYFVRALAIQFYLYRSRTINDSIPTVRFW